MSGSKTLAFAISYAQC